MKKLKELFIIAFLIYILTTNITFAEDTLVISADKISAEEGEEINVNIEIKEVQIASFMLEIYWDTNRLEYISGPENSNYLSNRILYTWISDSGENKDNILIEDFKFRTLQTGTANIVVTGEFYNSNGETINIEDSNLEIQIGSTNEEVVSSNESEEDISSDNTNLSVLRLNHEGISPDFDENIKEYYFIADTSIDDLVVTAIPENNESTVTITGNNNLKIGENTIEIKVTSEDKTETATYKIYVTKTENVDLANANLETLAIREATLSPEFSSTMTEYSTEIANSIEDINILAIPQMENATVKILGNDKMIVGDNNIQVIVTAENGTTIKKYYIKVHRRSKEEETEHHIEEELQAKKLALIMQEDDVEQKIDSYNESTEENNTNKYTNKYTNFIIAFILILVFISGFLIYRFKFKNKK